VSGKLRLVDDALPIGSNEAKVLIAAEFERTLGSGGPMSARDSGAPTRSAGGEGEPV
jgi:hypothetical protein